MVDGEIPPPNEAPPGLGLLEPPFLGRSRSAAYPGDVAKVPLPSLDEEDFMKPPADPKSSSFPLTKREDEAKRAEVSARMGTTKGPQIGLPGAGGMSSSSGAPSPGLADGPGKLAIGQQVAVRGTPGEEHEIPWSVHVDKFTTTNKNLTKKISWTVRGEEVKAMVQITAVKTGAGDKKGELGFKKADGMGTIELNVKDPPKNSPPMAITFVVGDTVRGPVKHTFAGRKQLCCVPNEVWNFKGSANPETSCVDFMVKVRVLEDEAHMEYDNYVGGQA